MHSIARGLALLVVAATVPTSAQQPGPGAMQRLAAHVGEATNALAAQASIVDQHSTDHAALTVELANDPDAARLQLLQFQMSQIQQQWEVVSTSPQTLNQMYASLSESVRQP